MKFSRQIFADGFFCVGNISGGMLEDLWASIEAQLCANNREKLKKIQVIASNYPKSTYFC